MSNSHQTETGISKVKKRFHTNQNFAETAVPYTLTNIKSTIRMLKFQA